MCPYLYVCLHVGLSTLISLVLFLGLSLSFYALVDECPLLFEQKWRSNSNMQELDHYIKVMATRSVAHDIDLTRRIDAYYWWSIFRSVQPYCGFVLRMHSYRSNGLQGTQNYLHDKRSVSISHDWNSGRWDEKQKRLSHGHLVTFQFMQLIFDTLWLDSEVFYLEMLVPYEPCWSVSQSDNLFRAVDLYGFEPRPRQSLRWNLEHIRSSHTFVLQYQCTCLVESCKSTCELSARRAISKISCIVLYKWR